MRRYRVTSETESQGERIVPGAEVDTLDVGIRKFTETVLATIDATEPQCVRLYDGADVIGCWDHETDSPPPVQAPREGIPAHSCDDADCWCHGSGDDNERGD